MLNPMSNEQRQVFQDIADSKNVIVDACAGSGEIDHDSLHSQGTSSKENLAIHIQLHVAA